MTFETEHDSRLAITLGDAGMKEICQTAQEYAVAVSFGCIEKREEKFYSAQITIDSRGEVIDVYHRVSPGWKEESAGAQYCEGKEFHSFEFMGKRIVVGLCGDLWYDENVLQVRQLQPELVFWPVYTDFHYKEWNETIKYEYAKQAEKICEKVLYVNSVCLDREEEEIARGGSALFSDGIVKEEVPSGKEAVLVVEV